MIGMLAGITRVSLNWTTGEFDMMVLSINVPPASVSKGKPYAPMILSASLPIVPRVFFFRRTQIRPLIVATEK